MWKLLSFNPSVQDVPDPEFNMSYSEVTYKLVMQRNPNYYIFNFMIPTFIMLEICCWGLFTKSNGKGNRDEKTSLVLAALVSLSVLLLMISDQVPKSSLEIPLIGNVQHIIAIATWNDPILLIQ